MTFAAGYFSSMDSAEDRLIGNVSAHLLEGFIVSGKTVELLVRSCLLLTVRALAITAARLMLELIATEHIFVLHICQ